MQRRLHGPHRLLGRHVALQDGAQRLAHGIQDAVGVYTQQQPAPGLHLLGAFGGVLLLSAIASGLNLVDVSPFWISTIRGLIILFAMLIEAQKVRYTAPAVAAARPAPAAGAAAD